MHEDIKYAMIHLYQTHGMKTMSRFQDYLISRMYEFPSTELQIYGQ
jgi:hypothetical protein